MPFRIYLVILGYETFLLDLSVEESLCQPLHDCGPADDVCPADRAELYVLPAVVTHQVAGDTLVDPHTPHLLQTHRTFQLCPPVSRWTTPRLASPTSCC